MELINVEDYIWIQQLDLDLVEQKSAAMFVYNEIIKTNYLERSKSKMFWLRNGVHQTANFSTKLYEHYNFLTAPYPGISKLYHSIKEMFYECLEREYGKNHYVEWHMQCWMNCYHHGEFIDWHEHWPSNTESWHGVYSIDVEPNSNTTYKLSEKYGSKEIVIQGKNNQMFMSKSDNNIHRSSEWNEDYPRITIAFDIVPSHHVYSFDQDHNHGSLINHWIPI